MVAVGGAVFLHLATDGQAAFAVRLAVGEGVGVDEPESAEAVGVVLGEGEGYIATHGVSQHNALVDTSFVEDGLHHPGHEVHGVDLAEGVGVAVTGQVDSDDTEIVHVAEHVGTPDVEVLEEPVEQYQGLLVVAAFVTVVYHVSVDHDCAVLFHILISFL